MLLPCACTQNIPRCRGSHQGLLGLGACREVSGAMAAAIKVGRDGFAPLLGSSGCRRKRGAGCSTLHSPGAVPFPLPSALLPTLVRATAITSVVFTEILLHFPFYPPFPSLFLLSGPFGLQCLTPGHFQRPIPSVPSAHPPSQLHLQSHCSLPPPPQTIWQKVDSRPPASGNGGAQF